MSKYMVLLSGGLDSTSLLAGLHGMYPGEVEALTILYGQKHIRELESAKAVTKFFNVPHHIFEIPNIFKGSGSTLIDADKPNVMLSYEEAQKLGGLSPAYVPFRNGILLSIAAGFALSRGASFVCLASHRGDTGIAGGYIYPDCTPEFDHHMRQAIGVGTDHKITMSTPFADMYKADIVEYGHHYHAPFELTWSCYNGWEKPCGYCSTCHERLEAFKRAHLIDPVQYMTEEELQMKMGGNNRCR
jgi:7-cyano-7-deazaguanine synthase